MSSEQKVTTPRELEEGAASTAAPSEHEHEKAVSTAHSKEEKEADIIAAYKEEADPTKAEGPETGLDDTDYPTGLRFWLVITALWLVIFLVALDQTIVSTAVPVITNNFNSFSDVGWYASAYLMTSTAFQPMAGRLYSLFSVKWVFFVCCFIFELGSLICAVAKDSSTFIGGRAVAGTGLAGLYVGAFVIVTMIAPLRLRPLLTSSMGAIYGIGACLGPIIGGAFTSGSAGWRWCFWLNLVLYAPVVSFIVLFFKLPSYKQDKVWYKRIANIDYLGTALILTAVVCILLVCQWGGIKYSWSDSKIIGLIVGFVVIWIAFWIDQYFQGENATIPLRLFTHRTVGFGSAVNFAVASAYFSVLYYTPIYFQSVQGSSAIRSGVQTLPLVFAVIFAVTASGTIVNKTGHYIPSIFFGTAALALGCASLAYLKPDSSQAFWCGTQFLTGFGAGWAWMLPFIAGSNALAVQDIPVGSSIVTFFQVLGGTIFVSVGQAIFQNKFVLYLDHIPGANTQQIVAHGVSAFREFTPAELLPAVSEAANRAVTKTFIMSAVVAAVGFFATFGMELNRKAAIQ